MPGFIYPGESGTTPPPAPPPVVKADPGHAASERNDSGPTVTYGTKVGPDGKTYRVTYENGIPVDAIAISGSSGAPQAPGVPPGGGVGGGGAMTAYEQAQVALDKQKLADAEAQQKADQTYREAQAIDAFNKNWQDYQVKNYYGSFGGPSSAAPAGSPWFYRLPEPTYVQNYYKNNPQAGPDPWSQPIQVSGYSGSGFLNGQQPGTQTVQAIGNTPASIPGQAPANPFPGATSGQGVSPNQFSGVPGQNGMASGPKGIASFGSPVPGAIGASSMTDRLSPDEIQMISSHPAANHFVLALPGAIDHFVNATGMGASGSPAMGAPSNPAMGAATMAPTPATGGANG